MGKKTITKSNITDSRNFLKLGFFFGLFSLFHKFTKSGKTMNAPLLLSILIALVCAALAFSHRSKSLSEEKVGEMSDKIFRKKADARSFLYRLKYPTRNKRGCIVRNEYCKSEKAPDLGTNCCNGRCKYHDSGWSQCKGGF